MKKVYVIVPIYNELEHVKSFIDCLKKQTYRDISLFVVDNGNDGSAEYIRDNYTPYYVFHGSENLFWGGSLQYLYNILSSLRPENAVVLMMNIDSTFGRHFVKTGVENVTPETLVVATAYDNDNHIQIDGGVNVDWGRLSFTLTEKDKNIASTRGLFLDMETFLNSGGFYPNLLPHYCSDYEFTHRLVDRGMKIVTPIDLTLFADAKSTGITNPKNLKELFSVKCPNNPWYKTVFIFMSCPVKHWFVNLLRAWRRVLLV